MKKSLVWSAVSYNDILLYSAIKITFIFNSSDVRSFVSGEPADMWYQGVCQGQAQSLR